MSLLSVPGSVLTKTMFMESPMKSPALWCTQSMFLSKHVWTVVTGRQRDAQTIKFWESIYTLLKWFILATNNIPWGRGHYSAIQWKKLDFREFLIKLS